MTTIQRSQLAKSAIERYHAEIQRLERRMPMEAHTIDPFRVLTVAERIQGHEARIEKVEIYL